ncbi:GatB/YqeY domain-containing protein [Dethiosulfatarculus sandiegensis]|nr:GatB/YqeY domain-containing protein [Dethiosulfatarculus sandiegensis]
MISSEVDAALKTAMKAHDQAATSCLRMVRAALKNKAKDLRRELNDEEEIACLSTLAKQRRDSIDQFRKGGREDLVAKEAAELKLIEQYLPRQLAEEDVARVLDEVFDELEPKSPKEMGMVMKAAMARLKGQADGKLVNQLVQKRLKG